MAEEEDKAEIRERENEEAMDEELLGADVLEELEQRRDLERAGRIGADIILDLQDKGPLYLYMQERRREAAQSLIQLAAIDPRDAVSIAANQATVREYLKILGWIEGRMDQAKEAEAIINEGYGSGTDTGSTEQN